MDYAQTRTIAENPKIWHEQNAILGEHPSIAKVNQYFAAATIISTAILAWAPESVQKAFLEGGIVVEVGAVGNNKRLGIKLSY